MRRLFEGDKTVYGAQPQAEYRWMKPELFHQVAYSVYGDKYGILLPQKQSRFVIIENKGVAETFRRQFQANWDNALKPKLNPPLYLDDKKKWG